MNPSLKWSDLNPVGRAIIVAIAALTFAIAAMAFALSYGALYAWIKDQHLYSGRLERGWPLMLDAAFIIAQLSAILGGILRGQRGWPIITMILTGGMTVWFNLQHAGADPGRRLAAALPPILMMLAFEIDISITKWVMKALGKPMTAGATPAALAPYQTPYQLPYPGYPGPVPGAIYRPDGTPTWGAPATAPPALWPQQPYGQMPTPPPSGNPQNGYPALQDKTPNTDAELGDGTKRQLVEAYLAERDPDQLARLTGNEIAVDLAGQGVTVTDRYARQILDQWTAGRQPTNGTRKRGSAPRKPQGRP